jgi:hypothetical protein
MPRLHVARRRVHAHRAAAGGGGGGVTHGIEIDASNTGHRGTPVASGIPAGTYTLNQAFFDTYNGGSSTFEGKTLTDVGFNGAASGVTATFRDCLLDGCYFELISAPNGLVTLDYCTIYGTENPYVNSTDYTWSQYAFCNANNMTLTRCDLEGYGSGQITCGDNFTVEECYVHDPAPHQSVANGGPEPDGTHHGCITIQMNACTDVVIRRCHIKAVRGTTAGWNSTGVSAGLTFYNDSTHTGPFDLTDNYFAGGGGYTSYWGAVPSKPDPYAVNITATGNIFGREFERYSGYYGPATAGDFTIASNTWSATWGALGVAPSGDPAEGSAVSAPTP